MLGPYDGEIQPSHKRALLEQSDVVVCSLPGPPATTNDVGAGRSASLLRVC